MSSPLPMLATIIVPGALVKAHKNDSFSQIDRID